MSAATFTVHPGYTFPLAILGLLVTSSALLPNNSGASPNLLVTFSLLWLFSVPLDIIWLTRHSERMATAAAFLVGTNMCFKLVSLYACSNALSQLGVLEGPGAGSGGGFGRSSGGLSFNSQSQFWTGGGGLSGGGLRATPATGNVPGGYRDDAQQEEGRVDLGEEDAQPVSSSTTLFDSGASPESDAPSASPKKPGYRSIN